MRIPPWIEDIARRTERLPASRKVLLAAMALLAAGATTATWVAMGPLPVLGAVAGVAAMAWYAWHRGRDFNGVSDAATCGACGGRCCRIYLPVSEGGSMPDDADSQEHARRFHGGVPPDEREYGVDPSYDDWRVHVDGRRAYAKGIRSSGVDTRYCSYWEPSTGCRIPRGLRPQICRTFACDELDAAVQARKGRGSGGTQPPA